MDIPEAHLSSPTGGCKLPIIYRSWLFTEKCVCVCLCLSERKIILRVINSSLRVLILRLQASRLLTSWDTGVLKFTRHNIISLWVSFCACVVSLNTDLQWQLPVSPSRNATLQTCHPTLSDPQYYGCLQVTLHNCLCLFIPASVSLAPCLCTPHTLLTSITYTGSYFYFCSSDSSAVPFLFCYISVLCFHLPSVPPGNKVHLNLI